MAQQDVGRGAVDRAERARNAKRGEMSATSSPRDEVQIGYCRRGKALARVVCAAEEKNARGTSRSQPRALS
jgi:hypothetical protein